MAMIEIGSCRYQPDQHSLTNSDGERWELPRAEQMVLSTLLAHQEHPVDKQQLRCGRYDTPQISESAVVRAVFQLRHFLGDDDHCLIQTIKGVGYRLSLVATPCAQTEAPAANQARRLRPRPPRWLWGIAALALLLLLIHGPVRQWERALVGPELPDPIELNVPGSDNLALYWLSPISSHVINLGQLAERLTALFAPCKNPPWQAVYASLSSDQQVLNLTLYGRDDHHTRLRNLKITDQRSSPDFLPLSWQTQEHLCD
ncbi:helix-turn-helix domain-containing protein [Ferrimonas balearica]|uniref:winged helix-turn-helix domain-containing protein n=1 Tax=Ferrimonas balearica TaxID=44012 RepID=UPI001C580ACC|nr:helix-turn-helix domain-containing protein [Ferrimonas balearica]MBW3140665.1 helix-turn-helix domain-containing protein [Ferrimonas balearica]